MHQSIVYRWRVMILVIAILLAMTLNGAFTLYMQRQWCGLVVTLDDVYRATPPTTDTGRNVAKEMHHLRNRMFC